MLKSIIISALRNFYRNRSFSIINIIGLSVSMSLGMLIILIVKEQYTFDNFHANADRIYRVNTIALRADGKEEYASTPLPVGSSLKENYGLVDQLVRINRNLRGDASYGNTNVPINGLIVDPSFLTVFNFPLEKGNPSTALSEPNHLIITSETASRIFGKTDPLGQTMTISGYGEFIVTGILKPFPSKTHFEFQVLASTTVLPSFEKLGIISPALEDWNNYYGNYVYFSLKEGKTSAEVSAALNEIYKKNYTNRKLETRDKGYEFQVQPLTEITPGREMSNQMGTGMPTFLLIFLGTLALVVLLMSIFNFTNLMIAKSLTRTREIGVRKVIGAHRYQVFLQFISETVVFALVAMIFSYILLQFLKAGYLQLPLNEEFSMSLHEGVSLYGIFVAFAVVVGIIAGLLPAGYLSAFKASSALKDSGNLKVYSKLTFRKILMVTQFSLSVIFVIVVLVIYRQINFMIHSDYGFDQKNIVNVRLQGLAFEKLANELQQLPGVLNVGAVSHRLGTWSDRSDDYRRFQGDEPFVMRDFKLDKQYIENIGLTFLAGTNFQSAPGEREREVILNETALQSFGFESPVAAMGQSIWVQDSVMLTVVGVVKDFHFRPMNNKIGPLALRNSHAGIAYLSAKIDPLQQKSVFASLESIWKKLDPIHPIDYQMMEAEIDDAYRQAGMQDILIIVGYITFLAITLACLGMLGMAMYATQTRIKEVGVRKVMGASVTDVVLLLSKSFMMLIGLAVIIGVPISIYLGQFFLDIYAYKIEITPLLILSGVFLIAGLGVLIIASQTFTAACSNPSKSLRYE